MDELRRTIHVEALNRAVLRTSLQTNRDVLRRVRRWPSVSVVNPFQIKGFAASELRRSKTDEIDSGVIARFAGSHRPPSCEPQAPELRELQKAERYLVSVKANVTQESNRLESGITFQAVKRSSERHIEDLELRISELERWMKKHIKQHERLNEHFKLISSIPRFNKTLTLLAN